MRTASYRRTRSKAAPTGKTARRRHPVAAICGGLVISLVLTAAGLMVGAFLLDKGLVPGGAESYSRIVGAVGAAAVFVGAFWTARTSSARPLVMALALGVLYMLLRILTGRIFGARIRFGGDWCLQAFLSALTALAAGLIARRPARRRG